MKNNVLISVLGEKDFSNLKEEQGRILRIINKSDELINVVFSDLIILYTPDGNKIDEDTGMAGASYLEGFDTFRKHINENKTHLKLNSYPINTSDPSDYKIVWSALYSIIEKLNLNYSQNKYYINMSSGTSTMKACFLLLTQAGLINAELIQSKYRGLNFVDLEIENFPTIKKLEKANKEISRLKNLLKKTDIKYDINEIIGDSDEILDIKKQINVVSEFNFPVLITGETGTGKELVASAIHNCSVNKNEPFIPVNCGAISENLVESELFGYVKGAFTGADKDRDGVFKAVGKGTLFLDEIGDLPKSMQVKLLRVINEKTFSRVGAIGEKIKFEGRIIAATNKNLLKMIKTDEFRDDLFYRITGEIIEVPALRNRKDDINKIADFLLSKLNDRNNQKIHFENNALEELKNYEWFGNVRELKQVIERAYIYARYNKTSITPDLIRFLPANIPENEGLEQISIPENFDFESHFEELKKEYYNEALRRTQGNIKKASKLLNIKYDAFYKQIKDRNIKY